MGITNHQIIAEEHKKLEEKIKNMEKKYKFIKAQVQRELAGKFLEKILAFNYQPEMIEPQIISIREWLEGLKNE